MRIIKEHKRLEDDRLYGKGKAPSLNLTPWLEGVNVTFKKPDYKILECMKNELYF